VDAGADKAPTIRRSYPCKRSRGMTGATAFSGIGALLRVGGAAMNFSPPMGTEPFHLGSSPSHCGEGYRAST
jgi:hypothetical protein